jgi:GTPase SAR1 family protein
MALDPRSLIKAIVYAVFDDEGPQPVVCIPDLDYTQQLLIAMKSISLLMGEQVYQEGREFESVKYFGILPFPDIHYTALTYFFLLYDEHARGKAKAATISLLVADTQQNFLYENMKSLSVLMARAAEILSEDIKYTKAKENILQLQQNVFNYIENNNRPIESKRIVKLLFTGLDASGKTSFLKAVKQKFSELLGIKPTKGIDRTEISLLGTNMVEWDVGGQRKYRDNFLRDADLYIYDTNLLFYLIDIRAPERFDEAFEFLNEIMNSLRSFKQFPPIIINFHKADPDVANSDPIRSNIQMMTERIQKEAVGFKVVFFETSIFNAYSLNKSFSEGLALISPNRDIFKTQLRWLAGKINAKCILLLNENSLIISDYAVNEVTGKVSEISAPHFQTLFRTFSDFKLLKKNNAIWHFEDEAILFYKWVIGTVPLYLLVLLDDRPDIIAHIEKILPDFADRAKPLMDTYL